MDTFQLDHLFLCVDAGAPEAESLREFGLTEGEPNVHPGQGTACRRFFFRNAYLELVWVRDEAEADSEPIRPTLLGPRWSGRRTGASPFGVCLRPTRPDAEGVPFPSWEYRPPYLPAPLALHVGEGAPLAEPMWVCIPFGRRPDDPDRPRHQPLEHSVGFREVTGVRLTGPGFADPSAVARAVALTGAVVLAEGPEHLLEVTFDGGGRTEGKDFRPGLPLVFRW
jgi:hypothetical protein